MFLSMVGYCLWSWKRTKHKFALLAIASVILFFAYNMDSFHQDDLLKPKQWPYQNISFPYLECSKIIEGDKPEERKAMDLMEHYGDAVDGVSENPLSTAHRNCQLYKEKRSFITSYLTEEERDFPIAFSIVVYKDIGQVERLLRAVYRPQNYYCFHVDAKATASVRSSIQSIASCFPNVFLSSRSFNVAWGDISVILAELTCMQDLIKYNWKYFINLTGQEFPLKTNRQLVRFLKDLKGTNEITGSLKRRRIYRTLLLEPAPHNIIITTGSVHIAVVRGFVQFMLTDSRADDFLQWVNRTFIPDETFFSSLNYSPNLNASGAYSGKLEDIEERANRLRFKLWYPSLCHGRRQREICIFNIQDLYYMIRSDKMFVNKFEKDYGQVAYDCLEEWHRNKTRNEYFGID